MDSKADIISMMNALGGSKIPFLFMVDFEVKNFKIFRLDEDLPPSMLFEFPGYAKSQSLPSTTDNLIFRKYPASYETYWNAFDLIQKEIHAGNTFLANLTFPTPIETNLSLQQIYHHSKAKYKILSDPEFVCFSPETFVKIEDGFISTYPMKGTISTDIDSADEKILADCKEIAEHSTIVDLLRNDISRFSENVCVKRFRYIERIHTHQGDLLQVSSEISGKLQKGYQNKLGDIIFSLLPAGSVSGAPKQETLRIIRQAEKSDRGYYTGVCGVFNGTSLDSAVMIRFIENLNGKLQFRSGGGITFLSDVVKEYNELIDKVYVPIIGNNQGK